MAQKQINGFVKFAIVLLILAANQLVSKQGPCRLRVMHLSSMIQGLPLGSLCLLEIAAQRQLQTLNGERDTTRLICELEPLLRVFLAIICGERPSTAFECRFQGAAAHGDRS